MSDGRAPVTASWKLAPRGLRIAAHFSEQLRKHFHDPVWASPSTQSRASSGINVSDRAAADRGEPKQSPGRAHGDRARGE